MVDYCTILQHIYKQGNLTGLVTSCIATVFSNTLMKVTQGMIQVTGGRERWYKQLLDDAGNWNESARSHSVENSLWKRLGTCLRQTTERVHVCLWVCMCTHTHTHTHTHTNIYIIHKCNRGPRVKMPTTQAQYGRIPNDEQCDCKRSFLGNMLVGC